MLEASPLEVIDYIKTFEMQMTDDLKKAAYNTIINYYEKHRNRMDYKSYREKGFIIGSGAIEGGNKKVIQARCKGSGMHWTVAGANSVARQLKMDHLDGTAPIKFAPVGGPLSTHRVA